jgi:ubiquinone/menaquinone biosynthesis C-methylase UbiE
MNNSTTRFSNRIENYVKYRPTYPEEIIPFLETITGLTSSFAIADVGSGTGISSKLFLDYGNTVYAIEPNKEMRSKAEELFALYNSFISINATAEDTTLKDTSADMIIAGQAFHWFDATKTKIEFRRIAKPHAYCILLWNERRTQSSFEKAYEELLLHYAIDYKEVDHKNVNEEKIAQFFSPNHFTLQTFSNKQVFDFKRLKGRLQSSSYTPDETHPLFAEMMNALQNIFEQHESGNAIQFNYETKLYAGKMLSY